MTWLGLGLGLVANHFDVVPVRTNDESCVVVRYLCLHRGSLPENTAGVQPRFRGTIPCPKTFRKKLYVRQNRVPRFHPHLLYVRFEWRSHYATYPIDSRPAFLIELRINQQEGEVLCLNNAKS